MKWINHYSIYYNWLLHNILGTINQKDYINNNKGVLHVFWCNAYVLWCKLYLVYVKYYNAVSELKRSVLVLRLSWKWIGRGVKKLNIV